jgi:hypothetical protein
MLMLASRSFSLSLLGPLPWLIAFALQLPEPARAEILNKDASFEWPVAGNSNPADAAWLGANNWKLTLTPNAPQPRVRRGSGAYRGAQHLEFPCDGSNDDIRTLEQDLDVPYAPNERYDPVGRSATRQMGLPRQGCALGPPHGRDWGYADQVRA